MDDKHNKLDDFLRDQFNDSSEDHTWNVPDDRVFENAMQTIAAGKKKKRRGWIILPLLFLAVLIGREYIHNGQVENLEDKITALEESLSTQALTEAANQAASALEENNTISSENNTISSGKNTNDVSSASTPLADAEKSVANSMPSDPESIQKATTSTKRSVTTPPTEFSNNTIDRVEKQQQALAVASDIGTVDEDDLVENEEATLTNRSANESTNWLSPFIDPLSIKGLSIATPQIDIALSSPSIPEAAPTKSVMPLRYGILLGGNQSWLTMKNIPESVNTKLYEYDNHQPGGGVYAFVEKPLSSKLSIQTGLGYQYYQNQSVLEDQFLFESSNVVQMPDGEVYQTDIDVTNPLGDYNTMLEFRVNDQMEDNDVINEYTAMKQKLHTLNLDLIVGYKVLNVGKFDLSVGAGVSVGYLVGLKNDFKMSCFYNGMKQSSQQLSPDQLDDTQKWYGQALGNISIGYQLSDRFSVMLQSQYRTNFTSLRRGTEANGSQTYLHAFSLSAGVGYTF